MKFEKRADGGEVTPASSETPETGKKPVIIYIPVSYTHLTLPTTSRV